MLYLSSAVRVVENFTYHRQFVGDNAVVLEFSARVGRLSVKGVDIIQFNAKGQIVDFEVMVRPANGLQALAVAMAQQLASQLADSDFLRGSPAGSCLHEDTTNSLRYDVQKCGPS